MRSAQHVNVESNIEWIISYILYRTENCPCK